MNRPESQPAIPEVLFELVDELNTVGMAELREPDANPYLGEDLLVSATRLQRMAGRLVLSEFQLRTNFGMAA